MRELKFRAWDKKAKRMMSGFFIGSQDGKLYGTVRVDPITIRREDGFDLMQYTGFSDKNGKEVYEGDVVEEKERGFTGVVEFRRGSFYACDYSDKTEVLLEVCHHSSEIIGNIHENPELLK